MLYALQLCMKNHPKALNIHEMPEIAWLQFVYFLTNGMNYEPSLTFFMFSMGKISRKLRFK